MVLLTFICCLQFTFIHDFYIKKFKFCFVSIYLFILLFTDWKFPTCIVEVKIWQHLFEQWSFSYHHVSLLPSPSFLSHNRLEFTSASIPWCIAGRRIMDIPFSWLPTEKCSRCGMQLDVSIVLSSQERVPRTHWPFCPHF